MDEYKRFARNYEGLNPKEEIFKQEPFFREIIKRYSIKKCLDCACGPGWHLFMLDNLGIECAGSDLSEEMLSLAKKNLKGKNIPLKIQDFQKLSDSWQETFDLVICMSTSINHMQTDEDVIKALDSMYQQLDEGGILIIDNGVADALINERPKLIPARIHKDQAYYFFLQYPDEDHIIFNILDVRKTRDSFEHDFETMTLKAITKENLEHCFAQTNFKRIHYYGDHDFSTYSAATGNRLIVVAEK
ncbi:MAG: methyltransferase domain-containing protein [Candidatus Aminicenantes bacterium]|nr:methyltransferase domain-containing protein [Candidatus Aminicenantes bacterium]NIM80609.1 methyltransferase domain-containing protein [Candidatus Aminicenantes bacterium]NIN19990.1 methyltransferase domain-containing protein [Candidatus Aminicenantes bacterium]NIN47968.1 methyltransferase domain-containing protein [Candidatus Aminicenantes bacterium]NIN89314.1 methyltransferase domain-containing protein [Candidatus Aminicenantes bacterium]